MKLRSVLLLAFLVSTGTGTAALDDTADTGVDTGSQVDPAYGEGARNAFSGQLKHVKIRLR